MITNIVRKTRTKKKVTELDHLLLKVETKESILPKAGYWYCNECGDYTCHKVYDKSTKCWSCNTILPFISREGKIQNINLFMI